MSTRPRPDHTPDRPHARHRPAEPSPSVGMPRTGRMIVQVVGFIIGLGLIIWCVKRATSGDADWQRLLDADPLLVAGLLVCTLTSLLMAGSAFWVTIQPVKPIRWTTLQALNFFASLLNYAPVRLGMASRVLYHLRVDHMRPLTVVGWFGTMGLVMGVVIASTGVATLVRPHLDFIWAGLLVALLVVGGLTLRASVQMPIAGFVIRRLHGMETLLTNRGVLWGGIALRVGDLAAFTGRMWCAARICGLELGFSDVLMIALAAQFISLSPFGRVGFREAVVAFVASRLSLDPSATPHDGVGPIFAQLALVDSAGEILMSIPLGLSTVPWMIRRLRRGGKTDSGPDVAAAPAPAVDAPDQDGSA